MWRRNYNVTNRNAPSLREILATVADKMAEVSPSLNRCFWKVAGLVDAVDDDDSQVGDILDLRNDNEILADDRLEEEFAQHKNVESEDENDEGSLDEEVQFIHDGINEIDISNVDTPQRKLKQSQITNFFAKK